MENLIDEIPAKERGVAIEDQNGHAKLPAHLVALPGGQWALWRCICLRGAGFPAAQVLKLSTPSCAAAADRVFEAEDVAERAMEAALVEVNSRLDALRSSGEWDSPEMRGPLVKALRTLRDGRLPKSFADDATLGALFDSVRQARAGIDPVLSKFREEYQAAVRQISSAVGQSLHSDRFREALIWQNRRACHNVLEDLLREPAEKGSRRSKQRQNEEMIATYWQRYCVKNDTIGFFGPVGWASWDLELEGLSVRPGPDMLAQRYVYFEGWGIDVLAAKLADDGELRQWMMPRLMPYLRTEGNTLHLPSTARPVMLSQRQANVLRACTGKLTARELAVRFINDGESGIRSEDEFYQILDGLQKKAVIMWTFEVMLAPGPEKTLRGLLERIEPDSLREAALQKLSEMDEARRTVARAAGDPERLDQALGELEETFTRLTGESPNRAEGQTYAARTLVYEDCRRDVVVELGSNMLAELAPPLSLVLTSARWISSRLAELYRQVFHEHYLELSRRANSPVVDALDFWMSVQPLVFGPEAARPAYSLLPSFQERWARVLKLPEGGRRHEYSSQQLRSRVEEAFGASRPGWRQARYHSPDVMIAATDVEAIRRGDYVFVLGEMHLACNTLSSSLFFEQHPAKEELLEYVAHDFPEPGISLVMPKQWPRQTLRTVPQLIPRNDYRVEFTFDSISPPGTDVLPVSELVVEETAEGLIGRTRDGSKSFDILDSFGEALTQLAVNSLKIVPAAPHTPRITIDRMVISRESWTFKAAELWFAFEKDEAERFLAVRRWTHTHGMPRFAFVKAPVETKPMYVDFASTIYVNILAKLIRRTAEYEAGDETITFGEMLPGSDETWLPDADGQTYTSEFRFVALDLTAGVAQVDSANGSDACQ